MKNVRFIFALAVIFLSAGLGYSQSTLAGRVVKVLDGKTVVIEISSGKLTAELQYIEVPEPDSHFTAPCATSENEAEQV